MDLENIAKLTKSIRSRMIATLPGLDSQIDMIIDTNFHDIRHIENLLDTFVNYGQLGVGRKQFDRLGSYYRTISPEGAEDYLSIYREMNGE